MEIHDQVPIVTGGASKLDANTARMLTEAGGKMVIADLNEAAGTALAQELGGRFVHCNITSKADGQAVIEAATSLGVLRGLVNCAGIAAASRTVGKTGSYPLDQFVRVISISLIGTFNTIRLATTTMASNASDAGGERGVTTNIASVAVFDGQISQAAYAASEGGVVTMTLAIARDLSRDGIRVITVVPGIFEMPVLLGMPAEVQDALGKMVPFPPRLGKPSEYAQLARTIVENPMLNGEAIRLDGAIRMQPEQAWRSGHEAVGNAIWRIIYHAASAAGDNDQSCRRTSTIAHVSSGDNGTTTNNEEDGSGNDNDGTTPAPISVPTTPNTALL